MTGLLKMWEICLLFVYQERHAVLPQADVTEPLNTNVARQDEFGLEFKTGKAKRVRAFLKDFYRAGSKA